MTNPMTSNDFIKVELAVNCEKKDENNLVDLIARTNGVRILDFCEAKKTIIIELNKSSECGIVDIQDKIEKNLGLTTVIKGIGGVLSAVSELMPTDNNVSNQSNDDKLFGVIRFSQLLNKKCYVDGLIDGFSTRSHQGKSYSAAIHEYGDLTGSNYENLGNAIIDLKKDVTIPDMMNDTEKNNSTSITLKSEIEDCDLASLIGRAVAICEKSDQSSSRYMSAGIISRASTISENAKQICTCSGKTIWQERQARTGN